MRRLYTVFPGQDGRFHAHFTPKVAALLGSMAHHIINAESEETATTIAGCLVRDALNGKSRISDNKPTVPVAPDLQTSLF